MGKIKSATLTSAEKELMQAKKEKALQIRENKTKERLNCGDDWFEVLKGEFNKPYFQTLQKFVAQERKGPMPIYPVEQDVFSWTRLCAFKDVKVVIIGQDPYHGPKQAHGLCFSVCPGVATPPSLKNIYREIANDIEGFKEPNHGYLTGWSKQGVLLLNACLTVRKSQPNSHKGKGWETFTDEVINQINKQRNNVVFLLWGGYAQKKGSKIDNKRHLVLKATHPSPLGANKGGWFGCKHFSKANEYLKKHNKEEIDWTNLSDEM